MTASRQLGHDEVLARDAAQNRAQFVSHTSQLKPVEGQLDRYDLLAERVSDRPAVGHDVPKSRCTMTFGRKILGIERGDHFLDLTLNRFQLVRCSARGLACAASLKFPYYFAVNVF
jgi:hypothetical protein